MVPGVPTMPASFYAPGGSVGYSSCERGMVCGQHPRGSVVLALPGEQLCKYSPGRRTQPSARASLLLPPTPAHPMPFSPVQTHSEYHIRAGGTGTPYHIFCCLRAHGESNSSCDPGWERTGRKGPWRVACWLQGGRVAEAELWSTAPVAVALRPVI